MKITREQFESILDELTQMMDTTDAINEMIIIFDILGADYSDIEELN